MKVRHVIMIVSLILILLIVMIAKDVKNTQKLTCTVNSNFHGMESEITLRIKVNHNKIKSINMIIDSIIPEEYAYQKQDLIDTLGADGRMKVTSTENGIRLTTGMNSDYFKSLGVNTKSSYTELKETLEFEGYTCK